MKIIETQLGIEYIIEMSEEVYQYFKDAYEGIKNNVG